MPAFLGFDWLFPSECLVLIGCSPQNAAAEGHIVHDKGPVWKSREDSIQPHQGSLPAQRVRSSTGSFNPPAIT